MTKTPIERSDALSILTLCGAVLALAALAAVSCRSPRNEYGEKE
jgi:hypothetical protein